MLTYDIKGGILYENLYKAIKNDILDGKLKANSKLPSKRVLSEHLKISKVTVENAYFQLLSEGYVYSIPKKGYFVEKINISKNEKTNINYKNVEKEVININSNLFPFSVWSKLTRQIILDYSDKLLNPIPSKGIYELREAISDYLYSFKGLKVSYNQIIIGSGTEYLYNLLIQMFGNKKIYIIENPGYSKIAKIYQNNGCNYEYINMDNNGISIDELKNMKGNILHISPNHHFPTGIITPISRRQEILSWANKSSDRYIIEDDYDSEFRFQGNPIPPLSSINNNKVIYMNTFSKTIAPSMRISYMVLPMELLDLFDDKLGFYSCSVPSFDQYILAKFMNDGYFERHLNRMKNYYKGFRNNILDGINNMKEKDKIKIIENSSGLHFILELKTNKKDYEIKKELEEFMITMESDYYINKIERKRIVVNYSLLNLEMVKGIINKLEGILND